jgi:hypothetical protein
MIHAMKAWQLSDDSPKQQPNVSCLRILVRGSLPLLEPSATPGGSTRASGGFPCASRCRKGGKYPLNLLRTALRALKPLFVARQHELFENISALGTAILKDWHWKIRLLLKI